MWKENLGINVIIENREWKVFLNSVESGDYQIARYGYVPLYPDSLPLLNIFTTDGTENFTGWSNSRYDALVRDGAREENLQKRNEWFLKAEDALLEECPVIPIFFYNSVFLLNPSVQGWYPDMMDRHPLKFVWISDEN